MKPSLNSHTNSVFYTLLSRHSRKQSQKFFRDYDLDFFFVLSFGKQILLTTFESIEESEEFKAPEVSSVKGVLELSKTLLDFSDWQGNEKLSQAITRAKDALTDLQLKSLKQSFSFVVRWYNRNRTTKCLKRLQKRSIDDNLRQLVLIRKDRVLVN